MSLQELSIVILNWNTKDLLKQCIYSVYNTVKNTKYEIIVVDNASKDGSPEMVKENFRDVLLIENVENVGYAKGNNIGMAKANGKFILLLNSDVILHENSIDQMVDYMRKNKNVGAAGPALILGNGSFQTGGAGYRPSAKTGFFYFTFLSNLFPTKFKGLFIKQSHYKDYKSYLLVDWLAGACLMVRKEVISQCGGLDESFFMYAEDAEWCERIENSGWQIAYLPYITVTHLHGASSKGKINPTWLTALFKYIDKTRGKKELQIFRASAFLGLSARAIIYFFLGTVKNKYFARAKEMFVYAKVSLSWVNEE